jgi:hypothetical protein
MTVEIDRRDRCVARHNKPVADTNAWAKRPAAMMRRYRMPPIRAQDCGENSADATARIGKLSRRGHCGKTGMRRSAGSGGRTAATQTVSGQRFDTLSRWSAAVEDRHLADEPARVGRGASLRGGSVSLHSAVVLGGGKKLFADGSAPHSYKLTRSRVSSTAS